STAHGSVFVVRDPRHVLLATTAPDPTVGLVFYDLKSALHALDGQPGRPEPTVVWQAAGGVSPEGGAGAAEAQAPRRRDARARVGCGLRTDLQAQARAQREPRRPLLRGR